MSQMSGYHCMEHFLIKMCKSDESNLIHFVDLCLFSHIFFTMFKPKGIRIS